MTIVKALTAGLWGALAASSLLLGAVLAMWLRPSNRLVGLVMGLGSGALLSAIVYELVPEAAKGDVPVGLGLTAGGLTFNFADWVIDSRGGSIAKASLLNSRQVRDWQSSWGHCWTASPNHWCLE
jgi:ZIP family zinc transporter